VMRIKTLSAIAAMTVAATVFGAIRAGDFQQDLAAKVDAAKKSGATTIVGQDGWLFLPAELRHLSVGTFWGEAAKAVSMATSPDHADPLPPILDFRDQLKKAGIDLLIVPVPAKAAIYPEEIDPGTMNSESSRLDASDAEFLGVLKKNDVNVLDLAPPFIQYRKDHPDKPLYTKEDTHWSGIGIDVAADLVAAQIRKEAWYVGVPQTKFTTSTAPINLTGDLAAGVTPPPGPESVILTSVKDDKGASVQSSRQSPLVLLGDSHSLIYSIGGEMLTTGSGFPENLAAKIGFAPDVVAVKGSGATGARVNLMRRADNMAGKKMVIWCLSVREFTEGQGWSKVPVIK